METKIIPTGWRTYWYELGGNRVEQDCSVAEMFNKGYYQMTQLFLKNVIYL